MDKEHICYLVEIEHEFYMDGDRYIVVHRILYEDKETAINKLKHEKDLGFAIGINVSKVKILVIEDISEWVKESENK